LMVDQLRNVLTGPQMYQMFAGLGQAYTGAQDRARKNDREDAERAMYARLGDPNTDFGTMARGLMSLGKVPEGAALYGLAQKDQERAAEAQWMRQFGGGGGAAPASPAMGGGKAASAPAELMPFFQEASQRTGVPVQVLMAKAQQESSFNPNARGKAGEIGLTQIMPSTARDPGFGMQGVDPSTLNDPRQNIMFGAQYLAARGKAAGVTNWNDPAQIAKALENYNGGGDPNYAANVMRYMQTGQMPSPQQVAQAPAPASDAPAPGAVPAQGGFVVPGSAPEAPSIANDPAVRRAAEAMRTAPTERTRARAKIDYDLAIKAAEERAAGNRPTDVQRNYNLARQQGYQGSLLDYQKELRAQTNVNIAGPEKEYDKTTGKQFAEFNMDIVKDARNASNKIATLNRMETLLQNPNIYTGAGANLVLQAKRIAKAAGIDVGDVGGEEALKAIGNQFALELRNPAGGAGMPGALSDKDREFLVASVPGLHLTREGNALIIDYSRRMAQRSLQIEGKRRDYIKRNKRLDDGFFEELSVWSEQNPLFTEQDAQRAAAIASQAPAQAGAASGGQSGLKPLAPDVRQQARDAIKSGAPAERVIQRLREQGIDPSGL